MPGFIFRGTLLWFSLEYSGIQDHGKIAHGVKLVPFLNKEVALRLLLMSFSDLFLRRRFRSFFANSFCCHVSVSLGNTKKVILPPQISEDFMAQPPDPGY